MAVRHFLNRILGYQFVVFCLAFVANSAASAEATKTPPVVNKQSESDTNIPDFMKIVVVDEGEPPTKEQIAIWKD